MTLSLSSVGALRLFNRPFVPAIDVSDGVVTLELVEEFLVEGAIGLEGWGVQPRVTVRDKLISMV